MIRAVLLFCAAALPAFADTPVVEAVTATRGADGWRFDVTVSHPDTGWDHYADGWRVEDEAGTDLGTRVLMHPHVTEQPFTRSLGGVAIPDGTARVYVRARDSVHGWSEPYAVDLR